MSVSRGSLDSGPTRQRRRCCSMSATQSNESPKRKKQNKKTIRMRSHPAAILIQHLVSLRTDSRLRVVRFKADVLEALSKIQCVRPPELIRVTSAWVFIFMGWLDLI